MATDDPLDELRRLRHDTESLCENDPKKYYEHLLDVQKQHASKLVRRQPAKPPDRKSAV